MSILHLTECVGGLVVHDETRKVAIVSKVNGARDAEGKQIKKWSVPKGGLEVDESPQEALARELEEEAGITHFKIKSVIGTYRRGKVTSKGDYIMKRITLYYCKTKQKKLKPLEDEKHPDALWVSPTKMVELLTFAEDREFLRKALSDIFNKKF